MAYGNFGGFGGANINQLMRQAQKVQEEMAKAKKELDLINKQILECKAYDEILNHASNMNIQIDLDDGVKVNYQKFQKLDGDKEKNIFSTYLKF